ncbi:MAG: hypothetical protein WCH32_15780 [Pseudomonadota bacterium]
MSFRRYNEILFAICGTLALMAVASVLGLYFLQMIQHRSSDAPGLVVRPAAHTTANAVSTAPPRIVLCDPILIPDSPYQLLPLGAALPPGARGNISFTSLNDVAQTRAGDIHCNTADNSRSIAIDVVVRNGETGEQRLLLNHAAEIVSISVPRPECAGGGGNVPCETLFWVIRDEDTNHDGVINWEDGDTMYQSGFNAKTLVRLSPRGHSILNWSWDARTGELLLQAMPITPATSTPSVPVLPDLLRANVRTPGIATPIVDPVLIEQLRARLTPH